MKRIGNLIFAVSTVCTFFFSTLVLADGLISVQSSVNRQELGPNEKLVVTLTVVSDKNVEISEPRIGQTTDLIFKNSWSSSNVSKRMVSTPSGMNWLTQNKREFNYEFLAKKEGRWQAPPISVVVDGKEYKTEAIEITVNKKYAQNSDPSSNRRKQSWPFPGAPNFDDIDKMEEELFNQLLQQRQRFGGGPKNLPPSKNLNINPNEAFFINVEVDKKEVYEGEQITSAWYIYTRGQMESLDRVKFPDLRGFWKEIIEEVPVIQFSEEIVNGIVYKKALLAAHALFPIKSGIATIDEYKIKSKVRLPLPGYSFGFGQSIEYTKSSRPMSIKVKPLPLEGRPQNFSGAVGQFEVNSKLEQNAFYVNQPFTLKVRFDGQGNAKLVEMPAVNWPVGVELYDVKSESKFLKDGHSYKEFELVLIPRSEGELKLPSISVGAFDPIKGTYYQKGTSEIVIHIEPAKNQTQGEQRLGDNTGNKTTPPIDILPQPIARAHLGYLQLAPLHWLYIFMLVGFSILARAGWALRWFRNDKSNRELLLVRLKKLDVEVKKTNYRKLGAELLNLTYLALGEVSGVGGGTLELEQLMDKVPPSLRNEMGAEIRKQFELFQTLSFAPEEILGDLKSVSRLEKIVVNAHKLIEGILSYQNESTT